MQISKEEIKDFKEIYKKEFNEDLDEKTAYIMAERLLNLLNTIWEKNDNQKHKQDNE